MPEEGKPCWKSGSSIGVEGLRSSPLRGYRTLHQWWEAPYAHTFEVVLEGQGEVQPVAQPLSDCMW